MENTDREDADVTKFCGNCKRDIKESAFITHEIHCRRFIVLCEHCEEPVPKKDLDNHYEEEHSPQPCELCEGIFPKDQLEDHKEKNCPAFQMECKYCELHVKRKDFHEHVDGCGSRTDPCELCNQRVMLKDMEEHKCGDTKSEEGALDPHTLQHIHGGISNLMFPHDIFSPVNGLHHHHHHQQHNLPPFLVGSDSRQHLPYDSHSEASVHHHHQSPYTVGASQSEINQPSPYESHREESIHVDPQWLASLTDACGDENLDRMLAQNLVVEDFRSGNFSSRAPEERDGLQTGGGFTRKDGHGVGAQEQHADMRNLVTPLANPTVDSSVTPQSFREGYLQEGDHSSMMKEQEESQEERDAEMARQIHKRDLAYCQAIERDAEIARQMFNRELSYSERDIDVPSSVSNEEKDAEIARQIHERDLAYSQRNGSSGINNNCDAELARQLHSCEERRDGPSHLDRDAELARQLHEGDIVHRYEERRDDAPYIRRECYDAELAKQLQLTYSSVEKREGIMEKHDAELARQLHEGDLVYPQKRDETARRQDLVSPEREELAPSSIDRESSHTHEGDPVAYPHQIYGSENMNRYGVHSDVRNGVGYLENNGFGGGGALRNEHSRAKTPPIKAENEDKVPCQYCEKLCPFNRIWEHQRICRNYYEILNDSGDDSGHEQVGGISYVTAQDDIVLMDEKIPASSSRNHHQTDVSVRSTCKYCNELIAESTLITHEVMCSANPDIHLKDVFSSSSLTTSVDRSAHHEGVSLVEQDTHRIGSGDDGPCEVCGKLISVKDLVRHESICQHQMRKKTPAGSSIKSKLAKKELATDKRTSAESAPPLKSKLAIQFPHASNGAMLTHSLQREKTTGSVSSVPSSQFRSPRSKAAPCKEDGPSQPSVVRSKLTVNNGDHRSDKRAATRLTGQRTAPGSKAAGVGTGPRVSHGSSLKNGTERFSGLSVPSPQFRSPRSKAALCKEDGPSQPSVVRTVSYNGDHKTAAASKGAPVSRLTGQRTGSKAAGVGTGSRVSGNGTETSLHRSRLRADHPSSLTADDGLEVKGEKSGSHAQLSQQKHKKDRKPHPYT